MKGVIYSDEALAELEHAVSGSPDPERFRDILDAALGDVASGLRQHPCAGRTRCRECILPGLPYTVVYEETDDSVRVVALAHHRRRPGYWMKRLRPN
jgi:plasmid stabilization system protein ParE